MILVNSKKVSNFVKKTERSIKELSLPSFRRIYMTTINRDNIQQSFTFLFTGLKSKKPFTLFVTYDKRGNPKYDYRYDLTCACLVNPSQLKDNTYIISSNVGKILLKQKVNDNKIVFEISFKKQRYVIYETVDVDLLKRIDTIALFPVYEDNSELIYMFLINYETNDLEDDDPRFQTNLRYISLVVIKFDKNNKTIKEIETIVNGEHYRDLYDRLDILYVRPSEKFYVFENLFAPDGTFPSNEWFHVNGINGLLRIVAIESTLDEEYTGLVCTDLDDSMFDDVTNAYYVYLMLNKDTISDIYGNIDVNSIIFTNIMLYCASLDRDLRYFINSKIVRLSCLVIEGFDEQVFRILRGRKGLVYLYKDRMVVKEFIEDNILEIDGIRIKILTE